MKKKIALVLSLCMAAAMLSACGPREPAQPQAQDTPAPQAADGKDYSGHTLYVANWQAYSSDTDYCEKAFEDKFGCSVEHVYYNSYEELMTTLQTGGSSTIDCCVLSQNYTQYFKDQDLILNIDPARIPNYAEVASQYRDISPYAVDAEGNTFAFPWTSGVSSLAYNPEKVNIEIKHWSDLLNPALKGHVCLFGDYGDGMIIASLISGQDPSDPANLDLDKVAASLKELKPQILSFWASNDEQEIPYRAGEFWAGEMWSGPYAKLVMEGKPVKLVHPEEGTVGYLDYWCVIKGTDEEDLACEWINWIESYELQYTMATGQGSSYVSPDGDPTYSPVNSKVLDSLNEEQLAAIGMSPMPTKICMLNYLSSEQKDAWVDVWETFKAS